MNDNKRQRQLPFDGDKEARRLERVARICGQHPKLTTAARMFDYDEATRLATGKNTPEPRGCDVTR